MCVCTEKGSPLNMMAMKRNEATDKLLCGMSCPKYSREKDADLRDLTRDDIEGAVGGYCVLVPYRETSTKKFQCQYRERCSVTGM